MMHSFNDSIDAGRSSHFANPPNRLERTSLLLPIELKYNPILSLPTTVDPALLLPSIPADEGTQFSSFLPVARMPLLLADTSKQAGGSSEFQSNGAIPSDSQKCSGEFHTRKPNGLGLVVWDDVKESKTTTQPSIRPPTPLSAESLFCDFPDPPPTYFTMQDPFYDYGLNIRFSFDGLMQNDILAERKALRATAVQSSGLATSAFQTYGKSELSYGLTFSSPPRSLEASTSLKDPSDFTGLVADINMFDKENDNAIFVRPRDLMGDYNAPGVQEPSSPKSVKVEDTLDGLTGQSASPLSATSQYLRAPQSDWPQIPTEHLPFLVERYLAHFAPKVTLDGGPSEELGLEHNITTAFQLDDASAHPYTPITAEILEAVEEPQQMEDLMKHRKKVTDKTNAPRLGPGSRTGVNVMNMCDLLVPQDIAIERAYEGIPVVAVARKTKYFLMTHPGERLSEDLLFSFAGRLSSSGQTMPGYRCYVEGCFKTTKRKDHMADHVRTHLGEKPFQCSVCGMGFIRNNDCQRHENNHRPDKKFVCECKAAFSRRDLFVRHQKTACTMTAVPPGCFRRSRKYSKTSSTGRKGAHAADGDDVTDFDYIPRDTTWAMVNG